MQRTPSEIATEIVLQFPKLSAQEADRLMLLIVEGIYDDRHSTNDFLQQKLAVSHLVLGKLRQDIENRLHPRLKP